jgi:hypothetical protein
MQTEKQRTYNNDRPSFEYRFVGEGRLVASIVLGFSGLISAFA